MTAAPTEHLREPDLARLAELLALQDGVIARRQVLECGLKPTEIRRRLRRRVWASVHPGVYVHHTGPLTWRQRAWAAVLDAWPAALCHDSALGHAGGSSRGGDDPAPLHIAIDRKRRVTRRSGVVVHHLARFAARVQWNTSPPRVRLEEALLDLAEDADDELRAIAHLADAMRSRLTTADRLLATLEDRPRLARRTFIRDVLDDVRDGTCSVLEHGYLQLVERPHGLPRPSRQSPTGAGRPGFRDVHYDEWGVIIELDGRLGHETAAARDRDLERDLDARVELGRVTARLGWGQVFTRPCTTARKVAALLGEGGWTGELTSCPRCPASQCRGSVPAGGTDPRH